MEEDAENEDIGTPLLNQIFETWVEPELSQRGLQLSRDQISKVVIEMDPSQARPIIRINEEATIIAEAKATRAIVAGEPVFEDDFDQVRMVRPAEIGDNSGWACFAVIKGHYVIGFDFRYNRSLAAALLKRADEFLAAARAALLTSPAVACDTAFSAAELSVQAQMLLQQQVTKNHWKRQNWLDAWTELENSPSTHSIALRELNSYRAAARYADGELNIPGTRLAELLDIAEEMIADAAARAGLVASPSTS
jgi:hypothetical protein